MSPSELLYGRRLRCKLDTWYPSVSDRVEHHQLRQKKAHDNSSPPRSFSVGDSVFAQNFTGSSPKWLPGTVVLVTGPLSYQVQLDSGGTVRRHVDAIRQRHYATVQPQTSIDPLFMPDIRPGPPRPPPLPPPRRSTRPRVPVDRYVAT